MVIWTHHSPSLPAFFSSFLHLKAIFAEIVLVRGWERMVRSWKFQFYWFGLNKKCCLVFLWEGFTYTPLTQKSLGNSYYNLKRIKINFVDMSSCRRIFRGKSILYFLCSIYMQYIIAKVEDQGSGHFIVGSANWPAAWLWGLDLFICTTRHVEY